MRRKRIRHSTFIQCVDLFLTYCTIRDLSPSTIEWYRQKLRGFTSFVIAKYNLMPRIAWITKEDVQQFLLSLQKSHKGKPRMTAFARHGYFATLRTFFNWLVADGIIAESPMNGFKPPKLPKLTIPTFSDGEVQRMLSHCNNDFIGRRNKAIVLVFYDTGMRLSELTNIDNRAIDWHQGLITIKGKGRKERVVRLGKKARTALFLYAHNHIFTTNHLWLQENGKPLSKWAIERIVKRLCQKAGVKVKCSPHTFRHTFAVNFLRHGDPLSLMEIGGWESLAMVERYSRYLRAERAIEAHKRYSPGDALPFP